MLSHPCGPKRRRYDIPFEFSADSRRMGDTSQTSWTFVEMPWDESGMGSIATGSEDPRTAGRSGRVLGGTGGA